MDLEIADKFLLTLLIITILIGIISNTLIKFKRKQTLRKKTINACYK